MVVQPETAVRSVLRFADFESWFVIVAMAIGALYLLYLGSRAFWRLRIIVDTPIARVRSAPQGYVELAGFARPADHELVSPLTSSPCLWYRFKVEEHYGFGRNKGWRTIDKGTSDDAFLVVEGEDSCLVEPAGAHARMRRHDRWYGPSRYPGGQRSGGWLDGLLLSHGRYRFSEERIVPEEPVFVLGHLETPRRGPEDREQLRRALLRVWKQDPKRMRSFDKDNDGHISPEEWERAREKAARLAERSEREQSRLPVRSRIRATGDQRHPFLISTFSEKELATRLRWQAFGLTAGFIALTAMVAFSILGKSAA